MDSFFVQEIQGVHIRVFVSESARYKGKPVYEAIVRKAKELGLSGATVVRGVLGFGADSEIHNAKVLRLSEDLPLVVELIDTEENMRKIMPFIDEVIEDGLITSEPMRFVQKQKGIKK